MLNALFFSGLPYLPNAAGWHGLIVYPLTLMDLLFTFVQGNLLTGLLIHIHSQGDRALNSLEPWMRTVYPFGFVMMFVSHLLVAYLNWDFTHQIGVPWASGSVALIAVLVWAAFSRLTINARYRNLLNWGQAGVALFLRGNQWLLGLRWFFNLLDSLSGLIRKSVFFLSGIIESPGGILWEFILLAAFIFLILSGAGA